MKLLFRLSIFLLINSSIFAQDAFSELTRFYSQAISIYEQFLDDMETANSIQEKESLIVNFVEYGVALKTYLSDIIRIYKTPISGPDFQDQFDEWQGLLGRAAIHIITAARENPNNEALQQALTDFNSY